MLSLAAARSGWLYALTTSGRLLRVDPGTMQVAWKSGQTYRALSILHQDG